MQLAQIPIRTHVHLKIITPWCVVKGEKKYQHQTLSWKKKKYWHIHPLPKSQVDPSKLYTPWRQKQGILISLFIYFERVDLKCAPLSKKLTDHRSSPRSLWGWKGWPGRALCTHSVDLERLLCAFAPHCTSMVEQTGFASSHDISGDRPGGATVWARTPGEPGKRKVDLNNRVIA